MYLLHISYGIVHNPYPSVRFFEDEPDEQQFSFFLPFPISPLFTS